MSGEIEPQQERERPRRGPRMVAIHDRDIVMLSDAARRLGMTTKEALTIAVRLLTKYADTQGGPDEQAKRWTNEWVKKPEPRS